MKRTPWFPADINPVRAGVYRVQKAALGEGWAHWNGKTWSHGYYRAELTAEAAITLERRHNAGAHPVLSWRGLTEETK